MALFGAIATAVAAGAFILGGVLMTGIRSLLGTPSSKLFHPGYGCLQFGMAGLSVIAGLSLGQLIGKPPAAGASSHARLCSTAEIL